MGSLGAGRSRIVRQSNCPTVEDGDGICLTKDGETVPLLDSKGRPIIVPENKKSAPPKTGNAFGHWAGRDVEFMQMPGGGIVQFDLSKLTLADFRSMRDHYQVNASLNVLSFMQHQSDFTIECEDKKIRDFCDEQIRNNWTMLNRTLAQANWAGFSPGALEWDNEGSRVVLDKVKDLIPEECVVNWKDEKGWAPPERTPPTFKKYDGIKQFGMQWPIPVENSLWYPLLMENGDYYGRKLLRPAFQSWFFSILVHLFANRYYERFGEPVPIGRAPFDDVIDVDGKTVKGNMYMLDLLRDLRNRSVVVLPNDKTPYANETQPDFDYEIEYLESQMRGADFERYLTRLDEEISIGLFTPILLMRTADVGSYNLGVGHMQVYLWMLNAMNDDRKVYIDKYLLSKMVDYNFGPNAPRAKIKYRKMGNTNSELMASLVTALVNGNQATVDLEELGTHVGMTLKEVRDTAKPPAKPGDDDAGDDPAQEDPEDDGGGTARVKVRRRSPSARAVVKEIVARVRPQVENAERNGIFDKNLDISMGYKRRMETALEEDGVSEAFASTHEMYERLDNWINLILEHGSEVGADGFLNMLESKLESEVDSALQA
jgi:hypothetical protein